MNRFAFALLGLVACATETTTVPAPKEPAEGAQPNEPVDTEQPDPNASTTPAPAECAPTITRKKSKCKNDNAWVRGTAHFDPKHLKSGASGGASPTLRVVLRHSFVIGDKEDSIGGRLHAFTSVKVAAESLTSGDVPFAIDMCETGAGMWSEENGAFHLVLILDEDGNNDLNEATTSTEAMVAATPGPNELVKMVDVDISCHTPAACLDVKLDCTGGTACTKITPVATCKTRAPGCGSSSVFCN